MIHWLQWTCVLFVLSGSFLNRMRDYMPPAHKQLIQDISHQPSLKSFVQQHNCEPLKQAYHLCVSKLLALRNYHITVVSRFITVPAARTRQLRKQSQDLEDETIAKAPIALEERGTGGSGIMNFLKTVRDHTKDAFIPETSWDVALPRRGKLESQRAVSPWQQIKLDIVMINKMTDCLSYMEFKQIWSSLSSKCKPSQPYCLPKDSISYLM